MTEFEEKFRDALGWVAKRRHPERDIARVTYFQEETYTEPGCPTCGPSTTVMVDVFYRDSRNRSMYVTVEGRLSSLVPEVGEWPGWSE